MDDRARGSRGRTEVMRRGTNTNKNKTERENMSVDVMFSLSVILGKLFAIYSYDAI